MGELLVIFPSRLLLTIIIAIRNLSLHNMISHIIHIRNNLEYYSKDRMYVRGRLTYLWLRIKLEIDMVAYLDNFK